MPSSSTIILLILIMFSCCYSQQQNYHKPIRTIEKLPVHTEVLNLRNYLFPREISENINVDFSLAKRDEFPYMYFLINHSSRGILTIRKEIDRDELCRLRRCRCNTSCDLELEILINTDQFNIELITISIIDRNDHKPIFLNNQLNLTIVENAQIGAMIKLESAIDYDQGRNSIIGYSIISSMYLPFALRYDLIRGDLSLVIEKELDRETVPLYQFDILAYDGDNQTGLLHMYVFISDINDSPPKFQQTIYHINNISENISIDSIICHVQADDADEGVNGEINYFLINHNPCFSIDQITGDIRVKCLLDYESQTTYRLEIEARDGGEGYQTDFCTVFINILDENDNSPIIHVYQDNIERNSDRIKIFLYESLEIKSVVLSLSITDQDSNENGRVTWKLDQSLTVPFELIRSTETTGELQTREKLDRELISEYNLTIEAYDHGKPYSRISKLYINIIILDINDNIPKFRENNLTITINEHVKFNHSYGYEIFHIHADDYDQGLNGEIRYSLINYDEKLFHIDSKTGIIRALKEFDRSKQDTYVLNIQASDQGIPSLSSQTKLIFKIINQNKYSPKCDIENKTIKYSIKENSSIGKIIGMISCYDEDNDELNGNISIDYQWIFNENNSFIIPFEILMKKENITTIILSINGTIDRELISFYLLNLSIYDHGNPRQIKIFSISIEILDENDHCPQLHLDSSFIIINRDITPNLFLLHLIATDNDKDLNGNITFQLSPSTSPLYIHLYSNGTLEVQTNSKLISNNSFIVLHIQIRDYGQPTPCFIVETLRLFIGTNQTDWQTILKNNNYHDTSLRLATEEYSQGKRMAHAYLNPSLSSQSSTSTFFQYTSRQQMIAIFIGTSILMFIVLLTMILCFIDCIQKRNKYNNSTKPILTTNHHQNKIPLKPKDFYNDNQYKKPVLVIASSSSSSNSHSSSSVDLTTRVNTAHNRSITNTYTYTALSTSDDLMPVDFDDNINNLIDDNGIELMMTTV